jgi:hypothetical protein
VSILSGRTCVIDRSAAAPVAALLDRVPAPPGTPLPVWGRVQLHATFEQPTVALLEDILRLGGDPPPPAPDDRIELPVPELPASAWLSPVAFAAWTACRAAMCAELGSCAIVSSGYRSPVFQAMLVVWLACAHGGDLDAALRRAHPPSRSEHCRATDHALDLTVAGSPPGRPWHFAATREYAWMRERGSEFGFVESLPAGTDDPVGPEPWHWRAPRC